MCVRERETVVCVHARVFYLFPPDWVFSKRDHIAPTQPYAVGDVMADLLGLSLSRSPLSLHLPTHSPTHTLSFPPLSPFTHSLTRSVCVSVYNVVILCLQNAARAIC